MKIKKTFQGELPENRIVNAKSNSQTDAYSANYLNDKLNKVVVSLEEPTTGEEVWIKRSINTLKFSDFTQEANGITFKMKDQVLSIKGTATAYIQGCYISIKKTLEEDMTLTQYTSGKADGLVAKAAYTDGGTYYYPNLFSVELNKGVYIDQLYFIISEGSVIDAEVRFQLERGKGTHDWQPVTEKQVFVKNENGVYEELVKKNLHVGIDKPKNGEDVWIKRNKNLFDLSKLEPGYISLQGQYLAQTENKEMFSDWIPVKPNTTYTFAILEGLIEYSPWLAIAQFNYGKEFLVRDTNYTTEKTFTTANDTRYVRISARNLRNAVNATLEEGSSLVRRLYTKDNDNNLYHLFETYSSAKVVFSGYAYTNTNQAYTFTEDGLYMVMCAVNGDNCCTIDMVVCQELQLYKTRIATAKNYVAINYSNNQVEFDVDYTGRCRIVKI